MARPFAFVGTLPQPLKTFYLLWLLTFPLAVVIGMTTRHGNVAMAPFGGIAVLTGLTLVTDFRGAARGMAEAVKTRRPWGVDYSRSVFARPAYARIFGAFAVVVGGLFIYTALSHR